MGKPECEKIIDIGQLNEASLDEFLFVLERQCSANIVLIDKSSIRVSGSAVSVAKVESYLNNLLSNSQNIELELPLKRARLESSSSVDSKDTTILSDDFSAFDYQVEDLLVSLRDEEKYGLIVSDSGLKENIDPMLHETSEDFAAKLGYSKDLYAQAVKKVGREADRNELLNELVKLKNSRKELHEEPQKERADRRRSSCSSMTTSKQLRPIIIDGSNVAMSHGKQKIFSCRGIQIAVDWFIPRGHKLIYVVIPLWRKESPSESNMISNQEVLKILDEERGAVNMIYTPSKTLKQRRIACYDDRYILNIACDKDGVVVSNDNFRDLYLENKPEWRKIIEERVLMFSFVDDMFMPPDDPHGRNGPHIDELLSFGSSSRTRVCHYGRHCTYGRNCKYAHPEREGEHILRDTPSNAPRPYSEPVPLTDAMCDDFKRLSLPDLNRNQPPPIVARSRHVSPQHPPALPSRRPTPQHHAPPLPPRSNGIHCGMRTTNESPYAPLPVHVEQAQMMYLARQQQPRLPPRRNRNYDTLPFTHPVIPIPPHAQNHQYYNLPPPPGAYIPSRRGRGGPYDNLPPNGQMPVYPPRNHAIYQTQQNYYRSRAPPADDSSDEDMPMVLEDTQMVESEHLRGISKRIHCRENGTESRMQAMVNVA
ncbi:ribonuclease ZC3H12C [Paramuricea clavata]|nr:ribonuclease ZC3H12C [Paramuricea clavata]